MIVSLHGGLSWVFKAQLLIVGSIRSRSLKEPLWEARCDALALSLPKLWGAQGACCCCTSLPEGVASTPLRALLALLWSVPRPTISAGSNASHAHFPCTFWGQGLPRAFPKAFCALLPPQCIHAGDKSSLTLNCNTSVMMSRALEVIYLVKIGMVLRILGQMATLEDMLSETLITQVSVSLLSLSMFLCNYVAMLV